jgi:hypothetical protein
MRHNLARRKQSRRALRRDRRRHVPTAVPPIPPGCFEVLCRVDAYADYVAVVDAETPEEAAALAREDPGAFKWEHRGSVEFDDCLYVALDRNGCEIEGTETGDC